MRKDYIYELDGHKGQSAIAKAFSIPLGTLKSRLRNGKTIREAVHFVDGRENNSGTPMYEWKGIKGIENIANAIGTTHTTIYKHLREGCSLDEAVTNIKRARRERSRFASFALNLKRSQSKWLVLRSQLIPIRFGKWR